MPLRRRSPPVGLTLARRFTGTLCFCSDRFFLPQRANTSAASRTPHSTRSVSVPYITCDAEKPCERGFLLQHPHGHREPRGSLRSPLGAHTRKRSPAGPRPHSPRAPATPGRSLPLPSPSLSRSLLMSPLSFSLSLTVSAITSHTRFFGKPPF